jgi:GTP-binding protein HflX
LLSDTVGFIRDLPHSLVASFKSTLEETRQADLLLHVADASSPTVFEQITAVYQVLTELGIEEKDTLLVLNKIDAIPNPLILNRVLDRYPNAIPVSARGNKGLSLLIEAVGEALGREFLDIEVEVDPADGKLLSYLSEKGEVVSREFGNQVTVVHVRMPAGAMGPVRKSAKSITPVSFDRDNQEVEVQSSSDATSGSTSSDVA